MPELKHTPGPWEYESEMGDMWVTGPNRNEPVICDIVARLTQFDEGTKEYTPVMQDEDEANAKLIAAAPDLLEALQRFIAFADKANNSHNDGFESSMVLQAKAAIDKATT
jgi:hypothetical protein